MTALRNACPSAVETQKHERVPAEAKGRESLTDSPRTFRAVPPSLPLSSFPPNQNETLPPWKMLLKSYLLLSPRKSPLVPECHVILKENQPNLCKSKASKEGRKRTRTKGQSHARTRESSPEASSRCAQVWRSLRTCSCIAGTSVSFPLKLCIFKDENVGCYSLIMSTAITYILLRRNNWLGAGSGPWWVGEQFLQISVVLSEL